MNETQTPIDAVIAWVDGNDEDHQRKRLKALEDVTGVPRNELATGRDSTRFLDNGEVYYCIRSIRIYMPWIRTIFLITDNQVPGFLTPELQERWRIRIVDHREILASYEWALPLFNSRSIETAIWRITGLASKFIYFNDDIVITRPLTPDDFFKDDKVVLRGKWNAAIRYGALRMMVNDLATYLARRMLGITRSMHLLMQIRSANLVGFTDCYFRIPHVPHPIRTETLRSWFAEHPALFEKNISYKFRNSDQFSALFVAHHLEIANRRAELIGAGDFVMINGEMDVALSLGYKLRQIRKGRAAFTCLHGLERFKKRHRDRITETLDQLPGDG